MGPSAIGAASLCFAELWIDVLRSVSEVVVQRRKAGLEDAGLGGVDGHGPSGAVDRLRIRSGSSGNVHVADGHLIFGW